MPGRTVTPEQLPICIAHARQSAIDAVDSANLAVHCTRELQVLLAAIVKLSVGCDSVHALAQVTSDLAGERLDHFSSLLDKAEERLATLNEIGGDHA